MSTNVQMIVFSVSLVVLLIAQVVGFGSPGWLYTSNDGSSMSIGLFQVCINAVCVSFFKFVEVYTGYIFLLILHLAGIVLLLIASIIACLATCRDNNRGDLQKILAFAFSAAAVILVAATWYAFAFYVNFVDSFGTISEIYLGISLGYSFYFSTLSGVGSLIVGIVACVQYQRAKPDSPGHVIVSDTQQLISVTQTIAPQPMYPQVHSSTQVIASTQYPGYPPQGHFDLQRY